MVEELYRRYRGELLRFAGNMTQDAAMAEDLVQDTFYLPLTRGTFNLPTLSAASVWQRTASSGSLSEST